MSTLNKYPNIVITGATPVPGGHLATMPFDEHVIRVFRQMADEAEAEIKAGRKAGKLLIRKRGEAGLSTSRSKAPYFVEFVPAAEVQAFFASLPKRESSGL